MTLPSPNLDDRTFEDLLLEAKARVVQTCPEWTDLSPHDPGVVLLEVFAYLTEVMLYRLNRLPEKVYVELLKLIGVKLHPPSAAVVSLTFQADAPVARAVEIPRGTRIAAERAEGGAPVVFTTDTEARLEVGAQSVQVVAHHAELVAAELLGVGTGRPGLSLRLKRAPVIAPTGDELDLVVGVEVGEDELDERVPARRLGEKVFRVWREVESFTHPGADAFVYVADRASGTVTFAPAVQREEEGGELAPAPAALAEVPPVGREIRAWYRRGGGPQGNVPAHALKAVRDPLPVKMTADNPRPAVGGRAGETLPNALLRGTEAIHSLHRAVAARDFEVLALRTSAAVARARAFTRAALWRHAPPGAVEVLLVPDLPPEVRGPSDEGVTAGALHEHQAEEVRRRIQEELDARRTMGTEVVASWTRLKCVSTAARVVAHRAEDPEAIRQRALARLNRMLSPLPQPGGGGGWRFGQALRASNVYDVLLSEPGVAHVEEVRLLVDEVPEATRALAADHHQPHTWYAASESTLFRSVNDGDGWEPAGAFAGELVDRAAAHPARPGLLAVAGRLRDDDKRSRLHLSRDCGETWEPQTQTVDAVEDLAWTIRDGQPLLLLATRVGLFELSLERGARPLQVVVDPADPDLGAWAVASAVDLAGTWRVAVSAMQGRGVFVFSGGGQRTFTGIGLTGEDVRVLRLQRDGPRTFLWAGLAAASGAEIGRGCRSVELTTGEGAAWQTWSKGWEGGSCLSLAFSGATVYAGTHRSGVLWLDSSREGVEWRRPDVGSGLPLREEGRLFQPVHAIAAAPDGKLLLAGGPSGVVRSTDARRWEPCSRKELMEPQKVTLPPTWLFCTGKHQLEVVHDDATL